MATKTETIKTDVKMAIAKNGKSSYIQQLENEQTSCSIFWSTTW